MKATVSLIKGENRYENVLKSLETIKTELKNKIKDSKKIIIKPNFVSTTVQLAATHVDAVKATLDFVSKYTDETILIAEGSAHETFDGFKNFGYFGLKKEYNIEFFDLNTDKNHKEVILFDSELKPMKVRISKTVVDSDCRISVAMLKTHDTVVATLGLKNMIVGSLLKSRHFPAGRFVGKIFGKTPISLFKDYKSAIHQGYPAINKNLFELAKIIPPHISVIDGFIGMEGDGPVSGTPVKMGVALAGTDFLAVDAVGCFLMGFDINKIGYLYYCKEAGLGVGDLDKIRIVGNATVEKVKRKFKPHYMYKKQLEWR